MAGLFWIFFLIWLFKCLVIKQAGEAEIQKHINFCWCLPVKEQKRPSYPSVQNSSMRNHSLSEEEMICRQIESLSQACISLQHENQELRAKLALIQEIAFRHGSV